MPDGSDQDARLSIRLETSIASIPAAEWDACNGPGAPFTSHSFLRILEESGSVGDGTGWSPHHMAVRDGNGRLVACAPLYLKSHSYGEYVFDHGWANAWQQAGGRYYPKLQLSVPFTPVTGRRLLLSAGAPEGTLELMMAALAKITGDNRLSSAHVTFPTKAEFDAFGKAGWLQRTGVQFHWENRGYGSFDDFLATFSSRKRKAVKKERRTVAESGLELLTLTGAELKPEHWDVFYRFYIDTSDRKWGSPYLTHEFFHLLGAEMADQVVLVMARDNGRWVAGALNLLGGDTLYGRNWGSRGDYPYLHFEACYYRAIEFAIERGLARVEAGAQGQHKIQRGYLPVPTYSAHWIPNASFRTAVADFLDREREEMEEEIALLAEESPYRKDGES
ncbi:GNAT family N-acetyltransferase [Indioceanicola profundi]|uniref:GNAT family N-acetyltransferase n=1 Tax=Indioceanicola profundi TaxID=2220096 RepID=UPI000E6A98CC|nr:GNAT family N-acetyltransferase [Indioceanicola profundi]